MEQSKWLWISGAGVVALVLFILFDPGADQGDKGDAFVWERSWEAIEYDPGKTRVDEAATLEAERLERLEDDPEDEEYEFNPDTYKGKYRFRMLRKAGLYEDSFDVETPRGGRPGAELVRHTGNLTVRNIFREWSNLKYKGVYDRRSARELDRDFDENGRRLLLFPKKDGDPVTVEIGRKLDNGNTVIRHSDDRESVYLVPSFLFQKLEYIFTNYRMKRVLHYPTGSYTREIEITDPQGRRVYLSQKRTKQDNKSEQRWYTDEGMEISLNNASQVDNYVKQIQIDRFNDQSQAPGRPALEQLWQKYAKDDYVIRVTVEKGDEVVMRLRGVGKNDDDDPAKAELKSTALEKKKTGEDSLLLLQAENREGIHLTAGRHGKNLRTKLTRVISEVQTKKREAENKKKAEELRKKNPPPPPPAPKPPAKQGD